MLSRVRVLCADVLGGLAFGSVALLLCAAGGAWCEPEGVAAAVLLFALAGWTGYLFWGLRDMVLPEDWEPEDLERVVYYPR